MNLDYQLDRAGWRAGYRPLQFAGHHRAMWQPQIEALTAHFRVLRYDTHGHGKTTKNGKVTPRPAG